MIVLSCSSGTGQLLVVVMTDCYLHHHRGGDGVDWPLSLSFPCGSGVGWPPDTDQGVGHHHVEAAECVGSARCDGWRGTRQVGTWTSRALKQTWKQL